MRMMSTLASILAIQAVLLYDGAGWTENDDPHLIADFNKIGWERGAVPRLPLTSWAKWCKAGFQLGEWDACPPR